MRTLSLNLEPSGSDGWSTHCPSSLKIQPWYAQRMPFFFGDAVGEIGLAVRARRLNEAKLSLGVAVEHEVLAEEAHLLGGIVGVDLGAGGDGVPVAPEELAHRRAGANLGQSLVLCCAEHSGAS